MNNTNNTESTQLSDEYFDQALADPMLHFLDYISRIENGDIKRVSKEDEESFNKYFTNEDGYLRSVYYGFSAGFNAATNLWTSLIWKEKSSDSTTTTETTK